MPVAELSTAILRFGPFELDAEREELRKSGFVLRLPHQPMRVLLLFVQRAGEVVTREELQEAIWGSQTHVDYEQGINAAIRQIRYHLGDNAEAPRYLRTIPRRGYVFIAPVEQVARPEPPLPATVAIEPVVKRPAAPIAIAPPPAAARPRLVLSVAMTLLVVALIAAAALWLRRPAAPAPAPAQPSGPRTVAVAPFTVIGRLPEGVDPRIFVQELRATIGSLSRRSVVLLEERSPTTAQVRIEGTIQQEVESVRVIVSGIDVASHTQLWSETYDRPLAEAHRMPIQIAYLVSHEMARRFLPAPRHEPLLRSKVSPQARQSYRLARLERARSVPDPDANRAEQLFEQAIRQDPKFAEAWSGLADIWAERMLGGPGPVRARAAARARECANRALALQPANVEARSALGGIAFQYDYDLPAAEQIFRGVVADDPEYVDGHNNLSMALTARGEVEGALHAYIAARELDPAEFDLHPSEASIYLRAHRFNEALAIYRDILAFRDSRASKWGILWASIAQERWTDATTFSRLIAGQPAVAGEATYEDFRKAFAALEPFILENYKRGAFDDYMVASYYAELGDATRAFDHLNRAVDAKVPVVCYLLVDPRLDPLRRDPRFATLLAKTKLARR
jgi:DNA-binding winged helix-turn-helix (wHTH) protein/tetratricopeptide (TPR) repeat protein